MSGPVYYQRPFTVQLVGLAGPKQSGKSTAADGLVAKGWHRMSFAAPIKAALQAIGVTEKQLSQDKEKEISWIGRSPRYLMQTLGTEWGRKRVHPDLWVRACKMKLHLLLNRGERVVFDDVRYPNEAEMIRRLGGTILEIQPRETPEQRRWPNWLRLWAGMGAYEGGHSSEVRLPSKLIDATVFNNSTKEELVERVEALLKS